MDMFSPDYNNISKRLIKAVIPDYGLHTDRIFLTKRGEEIKKVFPLLRSWPSVTLAEAELYRDDLSQQDICTGRLTMPDFLTLLFDPRSRSEWDDFVLKNAGQAENTSGPENEHRNITGERTQPESLLYEQQDMSEAWRDVIAER